MRRRVFVIIVAVAFFASIFSFGCASVADEEQPIRIGVLLDGPIDDGGWSQLPYEGVLRAAEEFGFEVNYTENVRFEDVPSLMRQYATEFDLVVANGYTFFDAMRSISVEFEDTMFLGLNMAEPSTNMMIARKEFGINGYLGAFLAAQMTENKKVGCIGAMETPQYAKQFSNMELVFSEVDPDIEFGFVYTGDWVDISLAREAAASLVDAGYDVIANNIDGASGAIASMAEDRPEKVYIIGWTGDEAHINPDIIISSMVYRLDIIAYNMVKEILVNDGYKPGQSIKYGVEVQGYGEFGNAVPQEVIDSCLEEQRRIKDGEVIVNTDVPGWQ